MNRKAPWKVCLLWVLIVVATPGAQRAGSVPSESRAYTDLAYLGDGHERHTLDLFVPNLQSPVPLIVWLHGGGWLESESRLFFEREIQQLKEPKDAA